METINEENLHKAVNYLSQQYFHKPFIDEVSLNYRLRTTGGRYIPSQRRIELNPKYLAEMDQGEFIGIIKHELVHYHLHIEGKGYKHGDADFKKLLKETGSPRYCRPLPSSKKMYKYVYQCTKCGYKYKRIRQVNTQKYRCGKCKGKLRQE